MLKKLFNILCLTALSSSTRCMEGDYFDINEGESSQNDSMVIDEIDLSQEYENDLKIQLKALILKGDESEIIQFLEDHAQFRRQRILEILDLISKGTLKSVIKYLENQYQIDSKKKLVKQAVIQGDVEQIQQLSDFSSFIKSNGKFSLKKYQKHLATLNLEPSLLDEIIAHNGINYETTSGTRLLQDLIRKNNSTKSILNFIKQAEPQELNAQNSKGITALHVAAVQWSKFHDEATKSQYKNIVKALLERGANPNIQDHNDIKPSDLTFFESNKDWSSWHVKDPGQAIEILETGSSGLNNKSQKTIKSKYNNSYLTFKTLIGLSITAMAIAYFCYRTFSKNTTTKIHKTEIY